jgi:hypothetical protein
VARYMVNATIALNDVNDARGLLTDLARVIEDNLVVIDTADVAMTVDPEPAETEWLSVEELASGPRLQGQRERCEAPIRPSA